MSVLHDLTWFQIGVLCGLAFICAAIINGIRRIETIESQLSHISGQLLDIDDLIGRIPGVEDYREPEGAEWAAESKHNPGANTRNRRNWRK
jgi:hypothetical protein